MPAWSLTVETLSSWMFRVEDLTIIVITCLSPYSHLSCQLLPIDTTRTVRLSTLINSLIKPTWLHLTMPIVILVPTSHKQLPQWTYTSQVPLQPCNSIFEGPTEPPTSQSHSPNPYLDQGKGHLPTYCSSSLVPCGSIWTLGPRIVPWVIGCVYILDFHLLQSLSWVYYLQALVSRIHFCMRRTLSECATCQHAHIHQPREKIQWKTHGYVGSYNRREI